MIRKRNPITVVMSTPTKTPEPKAPTLFPGKLIDQLLAQVQSKDAASLLGELGLAGLLKKQLAERMLAAKLTHHLDTETRQSKAGNYRNGLAPRMMPPITWKAREFNSLTPPAARPGQYPLRADVRGAKL